LGGYELTVAEWFERGLPNTVGPVSLDKLVEAQAGRACLQRPAPQVAAVELNQFGSLSLVVRVEPPIVWVGQGLLRLAVLVPLGSIGVGTGYPVE
jgi:hypothetical protein